MVATVPFIDVEQGRLHYREWGSGPLTLLVHGFGLDHRLWDELEARASDRRYVAVDLRGFGRSTPVSDPSLSMERLADDLSRVIRGLGAESADVAGFSMGGFALLALWERDPEVFRSVALLSARANGDSEDQRAGRDRLIDLLLREGREALASAFVPQLTSTAADGLITARLRTMMEETPFETLVAALRGMRDRPDRMHVMETLTVPTLVVAGAEDPLVPPALARAMAARAPSAGLRVLTGAGHTTPMESPDALLAELRRFWAQVG
ncbi:MAG: alpha/beta fold hydrolase [Nitriliruptorales bacterium]|nr:alpha/beta fold hydrolase [Nitriliruptorales bacterium]